MLKQGDTAMDIYDPIAELLGITPIQFEFNSDLLIESTIEIGGFKGKTHTLESRLAISLGNKNKVISEEAKLKISIANTGKKRDASCKEKMRLAKVGKKQSSEHIAAAAATRIGKKKAPYRIKLVVCDHCNRSFNAGNLKLHQKIHSGEVRLVHL